MKNYLFKLVLLIIVFFGINRINGQTNNFGNNLEIHIMPVKKVFTTSDTAFFKVTFTNKTDTVIQISKFPLVYYSDYLDMYPDNHDKDIYTFVLKQNKKHDYKPFLFSISGEIYGDLQKMREMRTRDSILREEKILLNKGCSITLLLDLFPLKSSFPSGKYKARIAFFLNNERPYILIKSDWAKFVFDNKNGK